jgi:hypothetical protein
VLFREIDLSGPYEERGEASPKNRVCWFQVHELNPVFERSSLEEALPGRMFRPAPFHDDKYHSRVLKVREINMAVRRRLRNLAPIDYAFLFGGPILFLLVAYFGLMAVIGPAPRPNPVRLLRNGAIPIGADADRVLHDLGPPNATEQKEDGSLVLHYLRTSMDSGTVSSDEALVDVSPDGHVTGIRFDRSTPPVAK